MSHRHSMQAIMLLLLAACRVVDLDAGDKACPCAVGYVCTAATNTCVLNDGNVFLADGAAGVDAGSDGWPRDVQDSDPVDARPGPVDVGPVDVGPVDVGPSDVGPSDAELPPSFCSGRNTLACVDFDNFSADTVTCDGGVAYGISPVGGRAAFPAGVGNNECFFTKQLTALPSTIWLRMSVQVRSSIPSTPGFWCPIVVLNSSAGYGEQAIALHPSGSYFAVWSSADTNRSAQTALAVPSDRQWHCLEARIVIGAAGSFQFYHDGVLINSYSADTRPRAAYSELQFGLTQSPADLSVGIDNIVLSSVRMPCP